MRKVTKKTMTEDIIGLIRFGFGPNACLTFIQATMALMSEEDYASFINEIAGSNYETLSFLTWRPSPQEHVSMMAFQNEVMDEYERRYGRTIRTMFEVEFVEGKGVSATPSSPDELMKMIKSILDDDDEEGGTGKNPFKKGNGPRPTIYG